MSARETPHDTSDVRTPAAAEHPISGGGEMGARMRAFDWSTTPIGPVASWSPSLRMMVRFLLANRFPLLLWWGPRFCQLYNDPYRPVLGTKHPKSMGQPASECWAEIWHIIGPLIETPYNGGPATWMEDLGLEINRHGFVEETHFTVAYSPVPDDTVPRGIGGVLATVHEITEKVVGERRVGVLRDLGTRTAEAKSAEEACAVAAATLAQHPKDIPFALLYLLDPDGRRARLAGAAGVARGAGVSPSVVDLGQAAGVGEGWPLAEAICTEAMHTVEDLGGRFEAVPPGPWSEPPHTAVVVPIRSNLAHQLAGLLVAGISPRLRLDERYRSFLELVTTQAATAVANARAYEEEKKRAEALAELDRAKTAFFSNVSHEFRTPLTLMLGPLEDALAEAVARPAAERERLEVAHRNALRLLKLVNTLLDFSRIEAGRLQAVYEPTDLAAYTAELASVFRSAIERAGLRLEVDCPPLPAPVYVDRDMWEKIVLNLLSNALKFTFEGAITVAMRLAGGEVELEIRDTGTGIPPEALPHLFERFHRIRGARARTHEGSGIGLALVQELVKLHGGSVAVESRSGEGTTFTLSVPTGRAHLPADRIGAARALESTALGAAPYVQEALRWLPDPPRAAAGGAGTAEPWFARDDLSFARGAPGTDAPAAGSTAGLPARILLADDNADMREYVRRLLATRWAVEAVGDGAAALAAARARVPDLVLADVMMPGLDGFELLRALRADPGTAAVPVILLSARAGEESRVEGLEAGADDYLVKPFSARELLARVQTHLQLARVRAEATRREQELNARLEAANVVLLDDITERRRAEDALRRRTAQFETLLNEAPLGVYLVDADFRIRQVNPTALRVFGNIPDLIGRDFGEVIQILWSRPYADEVVRLFRRTLDTGEPHTTPERIEARRDRGVTEYYEWQINRIPLPDGRYGVVCYFRDISAQVFARQVIAESEERYRGIVNQSIGGIAETDATGRFTTVNDRYCDITGYAREELLKLRIPDITHPEDLPRTLALLERLVADGTPFEIEKRYVRKDASPVWVHSSVSALRDAAGNVRSLIAVSIDITERKRAEKEIREINQHLVTAAVRERQLAEAAAAARTEAEAALQGREAFLARASHELRTPLTSALGSTRLLERALTGSLAEPPQQVLAVAQRSLDAMLLLVNNLLDASKLAAAGGGLVREDLPLAPLVHRSLEVVQTQARERGVGVRVDVPAELRVDADPLRLEQVLVNLLINGIKFTPPGGEVAVGAEGAGGAVVIRVRDTGEGLESGDLERIFEPFVQARGRQGQRTRGTGLGLAICRQIVQLHGGRIWAESEGRGRGSTFTVHLPASPAGSRAA